jgi:hypothetical protein
MDNSLKEYSTELKTIIQKSHDSFEKQLNYISAGALGISILFIEKVVKDISSTQCNWLLKLSWGLFTLTLISNLLSHIFTATKHNQTLSEIYSDNYEPQKAIDRNRAIKNWNIVSVALLFCGIISQIIFISINI